MRNSVKEEKKKKKKKYHCFVVLPKTQKNVGPRAIISRRSNRGYVGFDRLDFGTNDSYTYRDGFLRRLYEVFRRRLFRCVSIFYGYNIVCVCVERINNRKGVQRRTLKILSLPLRESRVSKNNFVTDQPKLRSDDGEGSSLCTIIVKISKLFFGVAYVYVDRIAQDPRASLCYKTGGFHRVIRLSRCADCARNTISK